MCTKLRTCDFLWQRVFLIYREMSLELGVCEDLLAVTDVAVFRTRQTRDVIILSFRECRVIGMSETDHRNSGPLLIVG
jgi:hypothetical protein